MTREERVLSRAQALASEVARMLELTDQDRVREYGTLGGHAVLSAAVLAIQEAAEILPEAAREIESTHAGR